MTTNPTSRFLIDPSLSACANQPEAYRTTPVDFRRWTWRDSAAAQMWAQLDYDERLLASLRAGKPIAPSNGWTPEQRFLARGAVDAVVSFLESKGVQVGPLDG